ncbi:MAG: hypothetical protein AVDCRST_MAG89-2761 [uncultured Gemmatimonadetes bacterium]|uniref:Uncharacterized protein n=1 Tax=uncultured Gemmatimonadota bacterium TaxID=203437 RepID=A0A6J4LY00_9BACT|nr:MAG: hypothetical protein AVDCRST_MAG89-2761 [uncultured Gemmatimonadota bacterium]
MRGVSARRRTRTGARTARAPVRRSERPSRRRGSPAREGGTAAGADARRSAPGGVTASADSADPMRDVGRDRAYFAVCLRGRTSAGAPRAPSSPLPWPRARPRRPRRMREPAAPPCRRGPRRSIRRSPAVER